MFISRRLPVVALAVAAVTAGAIPTAAYATSTGSPVGPKEVFIGLVNGKSAAAEIKVGCAGPAGGNGHVLPGQSVEVMPAPSAATNAGYTGSKASEIVLSIAVPVTDPPVSTAPPVVLKYYGTPVALPTTWVLPCGGPGAAIFQPRPTSKSARSATVSVSFVSPGAAQTAAPRIVANPSHVMVNQQVALRGTGFRPGATLELRECSSTYWTIPSDPCLTDNSVTVTTTSTGSFQTTMKAEICPAPSAPPQTERTCFIGVPKPGGLDTIRLQGAARIVVSWP